MMIVQTHTFTAPQPGPHLLVLGGIHGNEPCGTLAIEALMTRIHTGTLTLKAGTLTCISLCNPLAKTHDVRYVTHNLNRIMHPHPTPTCLEEHFANAVCHAIEACDYVLDLHSFHTPGVPFMFRDYNDPATVGFTRALGVPYTLTGWPELYAAAPDSSQGDTISYAHSLGKTGATVECGCHTDPAAIGLATRCLEGALTYLGMADIDGVFAGHTNTTVRFTHMEMKPNGGVLAKPWDNMDPVHAGDVIGHDGKGTPLLAPTDGFVIMPNHSAHVGDEWFYFGVKA